MPPIPIKPTLINAQRIDRQRDSHVIHEFGSHHDTGDEEAMDIQRIDRQSGLALGEPIEVNVSDNEARWAAIGVLQNPVKIVVDGDVGAGEAVEDRDFLGVQQAVEIVGLGDLFQKGGEKADELGHHPRTLQLCHRWLLSANCFAAAANADDDGICYDVEIYLYLKFFSI